MGGYHARFAPEINPNMKLYYVLAIGGLLLTTASFDTRAEKESFGTLKHLIALAGEKNGIGARPAGSVEEQQAADYISQQLRDLNLIPERQNFSIELDDFSGQSANVSALIPGRSEKQIVIGAHFDSTGVKQGSLGATDNASGVAVLLSVAEHLSQLKNLPFSIKLVFFGSEEVGKLGSKYYVEQLASGQRENVVAMLNLDTVIGGDTLYIHSASSTNFSCKNVAQPNLNTSGNFRDALLTYAQTRANLKVAFTLHDESDAFAQGETGDWSDHQAFACSGIPIAYIEATNMDIEGKGGKDGYSQTTNSAFWSCFSKSTLGSCEPDSETKWGEIWHTEFDRLERLNPIFAGRLNSQLQANVALIVGALRDQETMNKLMK